MTTPKIEISVSSTKATVKKQYQTPQLNSFGHIAELTAAGSLSMNERGMMGMMGMGRRMP